MAARSIDEYALASLKAVLQPLLGLRLSWLSIPTPAVAGFEPSQLAVMANTLTDGALPQVDLLALDDSQAAERLRSIGLGKAAGLIGERESYPDYVHEASGFRVELKGLFVDNPQLELKRPPTAREPSARLKENVTIEVVDAERDVLLVAATQLRDIKGVCSPEIIDLGVFSVIDCVAARDKRLEASPGRWFGSVPKVLSLAGRKRLMAGFQVTEEDYEKDTNFGKLNRIPYPPLMSFITAHGYKTPQQRAWHGPIP